MTPPGIPEFLTRTRVVRWGAVPLTGRAWSGRAPITGMQVSTDGGRSWSDADVEPSPGPYAWQAWRANWRADTPGVYELRCRARDASGAVQPAEPVWTAEGMGNNVAQRVHVQVV
jgi:hypothetical protein